jgi:hypothetical protein
LIGEIHKVLTPFFDRVKGRMAFKSRPALVLARADGEDYVVLPVSSVSRRQNLHPVYDIEIDPAIYPRLHLTKVCYVRTHKQLTVHVGEFCGWYGDVKGNYEELYLTILEKWEAFHQDAALQALR